MGCKRVWRRVVQLSFLARKTRKKHEILDIVFVSFCVFRGQKRANFLELNNPDE
jgi:hypothetical protein